MYITNDTDTVNTLFMYISNNVDIFIYKRTSNTWDVPRSTNHKKAFKITCDYIYNKKFTLDILLCTVYYHTGKNVNH